MSEYNGLMQDAKTEASSLLVKLNALTDEEWRELTERIKGHFEAVMGQKGYKIVHADPPDGCRHVVDNGNHCGLTEVQHDGSWYAGHEYVAR